MISMNNNNNRIVWVCLVVIARFIVAQFPDDFTTYGHNTAPLLYFDINFLFSNGPSNWTYKTTLNDRTTQWDRPFDDHFPGNWGPGTPVSQEEHDTTIELLLRWVDRTGADEFCYQNWIDSMVCLTKDENMLKWIEVNEKYVKLLERMETYDKRRRQVAMCCATMGALLASTLVWLESDCANRTVQYLTALEIATYKFPSQNFCEFLFFNNYTHCVHSQSKSIQKDFFNILPATIDDQFVLHRAKLEAH